MPSHSGLWEAAAEVQGLVERLVEAGAYRDTPNFDPLHDTAAVVEDIISYLLLSHGECQRVRGCISLVADLARDSFEKDQDLKFMASGVAASSAAGSAVSETGRKVACSSSGTSSANPVPSATHDSWDSANGRYSTRCTTQL